MPLNHIGGQVFRAPPPVTMPAINLPDLDSAAIEAEAKEAAAKIKTIRAGRDAWEQIAKSGSFSGWVAVGKALAVGRGFALRVTGANRPEGRRYCAEFSAWIEVHGFATMPKSTRSVAIELAENIEAIEQWRSTLDERTRRRLVHPLSNVRRWKATAQAREQAVTNTRKATAAWARFVAHVEALTPEEALPLWQAAQAQASEALCR